MASNPIASRLLLPLLGVMAVLVAALLSALVWLGMETGGISQLLRLTPWATAGGLAIAALVARVSRSGLRFSQTILDSEAKATHMARHDALTGLGNRTLLFERLSEAVASNQRNGGATAVLVIDLDRFKEVNDTLGHQVGDELIREAARRLAETTRTYDTLARLGGDEFAVVQSAATGRSAAALAERVVARLNGPVELSTGRVFLGCSVGVTLVEGGASEPAELLRQADMALYRSKDRGRGQYSFFETEMDSALKARRAIEADLRAALTEGGLDMVYQPQYDRAGRMAAVEALARWTHTERGAISPAYFVPLAEECGLIEQFSAFTLRRAFNDSLRWPGVKVAVNLSASQIKRVDFIEKLGRMLKETGAEPRNLELEITESALLADDPTTHATLTRLKDLGFTLALDDFGTGYSSLSYLRRFPVDRIKIDRSFIEKLGVEAEAAPLVRAIVQLAGALNLSVIAEGVETPEQRLLLAEAGCVDVQGYLTGRPMPAADLDALMRDARTAA